jgi:hypothetical protein
MSWTSELLKEMQVSCRWCTLIIVLLPEHILQFYDCYSLLRKFRTFMECCDRLCGLVVRVLGYRSGGPGSIPVATKKKVVGPERGPLSLVTTTKELLDRKVAAPV